jgi:phosphohistidine swiveling domain-containing protein
VRISAVSKLSGDFLTFGEQQERQGSGSACICFEGARFQPRRKYRKIIAALAAEGISLFKLIHYRRKKLREPASCAEAMPDKYIARNSPIAARMLDGEMIVMSTVDSTFVTLTEVAAAIWQAADGTTPLSQIVSHRICPEFDVDAHAAQQDAEQFVDELSDRGMFLVSEHPIHDVVPREVS